MADYEIGRHAEENAKAWDQLNSESFGMSPEPKPLSVPQVLLRVGGMIALFVAVGIIAGLVGPHIGPWLGYPD